MKTAKLVTGILSIVFTIMILFQSCAAGLSNALGDTGESSGTAGFLVAILMIAGSIIMIATRKTEKKGPSIACIVIFAFAAMIGYALAGSFGDLKFWSTWCLIMAVLNFIPLLSKKKNTNQSDNTDQA